MRSIFAPSGRRRVWLADIAAIVAVRYRFTMRRYTASKWPTPLALLAAVIGAIIGWPWVPFAAFLAIGGAVGVYLLATRILDGPGLTRTGWSVTYFGPLTARVGQLSALLGKRGYPIEIVEVDDAAEPLRVASPDQLLGGAQLALTARSIGRARVVLRLSGARTTGEQGLGLVESEDTSAGFYDELAQYTLAALAELIPGITYKGASSTIDAEPAESLSALLPVRPSRLDG